MAIDGRPVRNLFDLTSLLDERSVGDNVEVMLESLLVLLLAAAGQLRQLFGSTRFQWMLRALFAAGAGCCWIAGCLPYHPRVHVLAGHLAPLPASVSQVRALRGVEQAAPQAVTVTATLEAEGQ